MLVLTLSFPVVSSSALFERPVQDAEARLVVVGDTTLGTVVWFVCLVTRDFANFTAAERLSNTLTELPVSDAFFRATVTSVYIS